MLIQYDEYVPNFLPLGSSQYQIVRNRVNYLLNLNSLIFWLQLSSGFKRMFALRVRNKTKDRKICRSI